MAFVPLLVQFQVAKEDATHARVYPFQPLESPLDG